MANLGERVNFGSPDMLDKRADLAPLYGPKARYVDTLRLGILKGTGIGRLQIDSSRWTIEGEQSFDDNPFTVNKSDTQDHFSENVGVFRLPGHKMLRAGFRIMIKKWREQSHSDSSMRIEEYDSIKFPKPIIPGDDVEVGIMIEQVGTSTITANVNGKKPGEDKTLFEIFGVTGARIDSPQDFTEDQVLEAAAQTLGLVALGGKIDLSDDNSKVPVFLGTGKAQFLEQIYEGDELIFQAEVTDTTGRFIPTVTGTVTVYRKVQDLENGTIEAQPIARIEDLQFAMIPKKRVMPPK